MMICERCGKLFPDEEAYEVGYIYDDTPYGRVAIAKTMDLRDCECGGELTAARPCAVCGEWITEDGPEVCECCLEDAETLDNALALGEINTESIEVNGFIARLGAETVNAILTAFVKNAGIDYATIISQYLNSDPVYFAEFLADKAREERLRV